MNFENRASAELTLNLSILTENNRELYHNGILLPKDFEVCIIGNDRNKVFKKAVDFLENITCEYGISPIQSAIIELKDHQSSFSSFNNNIDVRYNIMVKSQGNVLNITV